MAKRIFGIGPESADLPASRMIHPLLSFGMCWVAITALFLGYTALVTPVSTVWLGIDA